MKDYLSIKKRAKDRLYSALIMLEQYNFEQGLEWGKDGVDPIKGNSKIEWLDKCQNIVRDYIDKKWGEK
jgi:hypothetical protein